MKEIHELVFHSHSKSLSVTDDVAVLGTTGRRIGLT